jgi:Reverse transcriptase (RNA-dependent DNA polymerase)
VIQLFYYWYSISNNVVRWGAALSAPYQLTSGVRQGSVISPVLFAIYVDDMLNKFKFNGCTFHGVSVSAIMYADDLVLVSSSVHGMQSMVNVCCNELMGLDLSINFDKSVVLRIGKGCNKICGNIQAMGSKIKWVTEAKYLGIYIRSGQKFVCNFDKQKAKFYRSANSIFAKLGNLQNTPVTLHLVQSIALPTLTYALEALALTKTQIVSLEHPWSRMFMKLFKTFNQAIVQQCQYY